jgi:hypothetical protein
MSYKEKHNGFETSLVVLCEVERNQFDHWVSSSCTHHTDPKVTVRWNDEEGVAVEYYDSSKECGEEIALGMAITRLIERGYNGYGVASALKRGFLRRVRAQELRGVTIEIDGEVVVGARNMTRYNHMLDVAFSVSSEEEDPYKLSKSEVISALEDRLESLKENYCGEAFGHCDTYEED